MENVQFWAIIIAACFITYRINKKRKKYLWKTRMILKSMVYMVVISSITLTWAYCQFAKGTGYAVQIGKSGYSLVAVSKTLMKEKIKKVFTKTNKILVPITPKRAARLSGKTFKVITPMVRLTQDITCDIGLQPIKPKVSFKQKVWRGGGNVIKGTIKTVLTPVGILFSIFK